MKFCLLIIFLFALTFTIQAQKGFYIKRLSAGYRISEIDAVGTNPTVISPLLKDPVTYNEFLSHFIYNGYSGNPDIQTVHTFYMNAEIGKKRRYGFWKRTYLQGGLFVTNRLSTDAGTLENHYMIDTTIYNTTYSLTHQTQYFGINFGINRTTRLARRLQSTIGLQIQGGIALLHNYQPTLDSSFLRIGDFARWDTVYNEQLSTLQGRHYFQWQIMLPLGLEYEVVRNKWFIRLELVPAFAGNRYKNKSLSAEEAHAAGLWFIYKL